MTDIVRKKFPLRNFARDRHVAYLKIACDAALGFVEDFNKTVPE